MSETQTADQNVATPAAPAAPVKSQASQQKQDDKKGKKSKDSKLKVKVEAPLPKLEPKSYIVETDKTVDVVFEMPGVRKKDVKLRTTIRSVSVKATRKAAKLSKKADRTSVQHGRYEKTIDLPCEINPNKTKAKIDQGVLKISLAKKSMSTEQHKVSVK